MEVVFKALETLSTLGEGRLARTAILAINGLEATHEAVVKELTESRDEWKRQCRLMEAAVKKAEERIARLEHLNLSTRCAYCGEFFEADADGRKTEAVTEHIRICLKHPMRAVERHLEAVEEQNSQLKEQIDTLEAEILHMKKHTWCAYCGHEIHIDDEAATKISEHIMACEKHPLHAVLATNARQAEEIERLQKALQVIFNTTTDYSDREIARNALKQEEVKGIDYPEDHEAVMTIVTTTEVDYGSQPSLR